MVLDGAQLLVYLPWAFAGVLLLCLVAAALWTARFSIRLRNALEHKQQELDLAHSEIGRAHV